MAVISADDLRPDIDIADIRWAMEMDKILEKIANYPSFTGTEFLATHKTIDDHPYSAAFGQFLGNGIDPDTANILAFGFNQFDLVSKNLEDPLRHVAMRIYSRFEEIGYWD